MELDPRPALRTLRIAEKVATAPAKAVTKVVKKTAQALEPEREMER